MEYTKSQKRKMVAAFKRAAKVMLLRRNIATMEKHTYICLAIAATVADRSTVRLCCDLIEARLDGWGTLRDWLQYEAKIDPRELTFEAVQQHRFNWLQQLIAEFSH